MSDYRSWRPIHRAMCPEAGPRDMFVVMLINGVRVGIQSIAEYAQLRVGAEKLAREQQCQVKLLPMGGDELMNYLGLKPADPKPMSEMDPAFRQQAIQNCMDVLRECADPREREDALALLGQLGAIQ